MSEVESRDGRESEEDEGDGEDWFDQDGVGADVGGDGTDCSLRPHSSGSRSSVCAFRVLWRRHVYDVEWDIMPRIEAT